MGDVGEFVVYRDGREERVGGRTTRKRLTIKWTGPDSPRFKSPSVFEMKRTTKTWKEES